MGHLRMIGGEELIRRIYVVRVNLIRRIRRHLLREEGAVLALVALLALRTLVIANSSKVLVWGRLEGHQSL